MTAPYRTVALDRRMLAVLPNHQRIALGQGKVFSAPHLRRCDRLLQGWRCGIQEIYAEVPAPCQQDRHGSYVPRMGDQRMAADLVRPRPRR